MITSARPHLSEALDFSRTRVHAQPRSDSLCLIPLIFCPARGPEVPAASFTDYLNTVEQASFGMSLNNLIGQQFGDRPEGKSLDRYPDHNGNYEPSNCRWATQKEQTRNTRRNRLITFDGETLCMADWADRLGIADCQMWSRIRKWPIERALTEPRNERFNTRGAR